MANFTDPLRVMHRVSEVQRIHDCPLLFDFQVVVVEKAQDFLLDLHAVRIKEEQCPIIMKVPLTKTNGELDKVLNLLIPTWNLSRDIGNSWNWQTIGILCNNEVHCSLLNHLA